MHRVEVWQSMFMFLALLFLVSCVASNSSSSSDQGGVERRGRVITPEQSWEPASSDEETVSHEESGEEVSPGQDESGASDESGESSGGSSSGDSSDDGVTHVIEAPTMTIKLFIGGEEHPLDEPIWVHDGEQVVCEFRFSATGSELAHYVIENAAQVSVKKEGDLSGFEASVQYVFTFIDRLWGDGGVTVTLFNRQGSMEMRQIPVAMIPMPGRGPR